MRCGHADCSWDFWVLDFGLYDSGICLFFVFVLDAIFCGTIFFPFSGHCVAS